MGVLFLLIGFTFWSLHTISSGVTRTISTGSITLRVALSFFVSYLVCGLTPAAKFKKLVDAIKATEKILGHIQTSSARDHLDARLLEYVLVICCRTCTRLTFSIFRAKLSASKIHAQLFETHSATWQQYLQNRTEIFLSVNHWAKMVKKIQASALVSMVRNACVEG
jgi:hypothetical protein